LKLNRLERRAARNRKAKLKRVKRRRRDCTEYNPHRTGSPPKKRYTDKAEAERDRRMTYIMDPSRGPVKTFPCSACGGYHIGHPRYDLA
jgi:hypothetical protein